MVLILKECSTQAAGPRTVSSEMITAYQTTWLAMQKPIIQTLSERFKLQEVSSFCCIAFAHSLTSMMNQLAFWEMAQGIVIGILSLLNLRKSGIEGEATRKCQTWLCFVLVQSYTLVNTVIYCSIDIYVNTSCVLIKVTLSLPLIFVLQMCL